MKKWIIMIIVIGMLGWAFFDLINSNKKSAEIDDVQEVTAEDGSNETDEPVTGLEVGNKAPDFELETLNGDNVKLSDLRGKRVMINFWATWCPPCRAEMPDMEKFYQDKDIIILAVNLTDSESSLGDVDTFAEEFNLTFPILLDTHLEVANLYAIQPIPTSFMVDSNGIITYKAFGAMNYNLMVQEYEKME